MKVQDSFLITDSAAERICELVQKKQNDKLKLRIRVDGGGCSGFQYHFEFDEEKHEDDHAFSHQAAEVLIDEMSLSFVKGSTLDYIDKLGAAAFEIKNPNATANCGCGNSFSV